jgi:hypothetical protein
MFEAPDDAVSQFHAELLADLVNENVNRENLAICAHVVANLPTQAAILGQGTVCFLDGLFLLLKVVLERKPLLIPFADIVWRGRYDEPRSTARNLAQEFDSVAVKESRLSFRVVTRHNSVLLHGDRQSFHRGWYEELAEHLHYNENARHRPRPKFWALFVEN